MIPHATLVAMLAAARAHADGGDAGGFVMRADREPSLIGHTEEKRELCPIHGWVGRVAFAREHFKCLPVGEPCSHCNGTKISGSGLCDHCDGQGVEPPAAPMIAALEPPAVPELTSRERGRRGRAVMGTRSATIAAKKISKRDLADEAEDLALELAQLDALRPKTRADCVDGPRPCPWVSCKHHLALDINPETGSIKINHPDLEPWDLDNSCALDVAEQANTLEKVGEILNVTRERLRQIELIGLHKLKSMTVVRHGIGPGAFVERGEHPIAEAEES